MMDVFGGVKGWPGLKSFDGDERKHRQLYLAFRLVGGLIDMLFALFWLYMIYRQDGELCCSTDPEAEQDSRTVGSSRPVVGKPVSVQNPSDGYALADGGDASSPPTE